MNRDRCTCEGYPGADVERKHTPRLRHDSAELALRTEGLSEQADVSRDHREDRRPISDERIHQSAVRDADKNDYVRNSIRQIVQNFTALARLACRDRDHSVEHVEPEPQITKQRRNDQEPSTVS